MIIFVTLSVRCNGLWAWVGRERRHLLKRIEEPMTQFESNQNVLAGKDAKRIIKVSQSDYIKCQPSVSHKMRNLSSYPV